MAAGVRIHVRDNKLPRLMKRLPDAVGDIVQGGARTAKKVAQIRVPVLTGALQASIVAEGHGLKAIVKSDLEYAAIIEYGGVNRPAQPYLRPGAAAGEVYIQKELSKLAARLERL
jgi:hypothetical protein